MAILGYNTNGSAAASAIATTRMYVSKFTLASAQTMTELHGWFSKGAADGTTIRLVIYADSAGSPAARVAYTSLITLAAGSGDVELSEVGFSVALAAGDYWLGFYSSTGTGIATCRGEPTGGTHKGKTTGAASPPDDPFGTTDTSGTRKHSVWAVLSTSTTWNGSSTVSLTGTVTTAGTVITHATSHGISVVAETVAITTAGVTRLGLVPRFAGSLVLVPRAPDSLVLTPR